MDKFWEPIVKEILNYDVSNLTGWQFKKMEDITEKVFNHILPYKAKNGVYFSSGIGLSASKGLVYFGNYGSHGKNEKGENIYKLMLRYSPLFSNESKYALSCIVNSLDEKALEKISIKIVESNKLFAKNLIGDYV